MVAARLGYLPGDVRIIAPDLRGYGRTAAKPVDATRGLGDMADDLRSLLVVLGLADRGTVNAAGLACRARCSPGWRFSIDGYTRDSPYRPRVHSVGSDTPGW